jgi:hypothetical protein
MKYNVFNREDGRPTVVNTLEEAIALRQEFFTALCAKLSHLCPIIKETVEDEDLKWEKIDNHEINIVEQVYVDGKLDFAPDQEIPEV